MKLLYSVAVFCALMLTAMSYPHPELDTDQPDDDFGFHEATMLRYRRQSPNFNLPQIPQIQPQQEVPNPRIGGNIDYDRESGLMATITGDATLWQSSNGRSDVGVNGYYSRGFSGPARGQQSYGGNLVYTYRF